MMLAHDIVGKEEDEDIERQYNSLYYVLHWLALLRVCLCVAVAESDLLWTASYTVS